MYVVNEELKLYFHLFVSEPWLLTGKLQVYSSANNRLKYYKSLSILFPD